MIRTLCTLAPGTKADGTRCLKGELTHELRTTNAEGVERTYPAGTRLVLSKRGDRYQLLALVAESDALPPEPSADELDRYECPF